MTWSAVFVAFVVAHLAGDLLLQTEFQAQHKHRGLGRDAVARRALGTHVATYTLAFLPVLAWIGIEHSAAVAVVIAVAVALPHLLTDDGRVVSWWLQTVKRSPDASAPLTAAVDQAMHAVALLGAALLAMAL